MPKGPKGEKHTVKVMRIAMGQKFQTETLPGTATPFVVTPNLTIVARSGVSLDQ